LSYEKAYWTGRYEPAVQELLRREVGPGDIVYDVGAHHGFFSVCAARLGARVVAFEASPQNAARVRRNAELNALSIEVVEAAVWDAEDGVELVPGDSDSEWAAAPGGTLPSVTLDGAAREHGEPTFLKIDVEGAEGRVLRGAERLLREARPRIVCELHGEEARAEVLPLLDGYDVTRVASEWRVLAVPRSG
jgi:FkbM family methyltransferase